MTRNQHHYHKNLAIIISNNIITYTEVIKINNLRKHVKNEYSTLPSIDMLEAEVSVTVFLLPCIIV